MIDHYCRSKSSEALDENLLNNEIFRELAGTLRVLPEKLRDIIALRYYDRKLLTEVVEIMDLSYGTVKLRHQGALAKPGKMLW